MAKSYSKEQIEVKLREAKKLASAGETQVAIAHTIGVAPRTYRRWRAKYPHVDAMARVGGGLDAMARVGGGISAMARVGGG